MACVIVEGYTLDCRQGAGGVANIYLTEFANLSQSGTTASSGVVTAIAVTSGKKFWSFEVDMEDAEFKETPTVSIENGTTFYLQELTFSVYKWTAKNRNIVRLLTQNRLAVVVKSVDGTYYLAGQTRAMHLTAAPTTTGKASGDKNGYTITLTGKEPEPANTFTNGTLITSLL